MAIECPVCVTHCSNPPLYQYTASEAAAHFCPITRNQERNQRLESSIRKLWNGDSCIILRCPDCQFAFGYPFVGGDEEFYSILHEQKGYPSWRWDYDIAISEALNSYQTGKIIDIGAGAGVFLRNLDEAWQCFAIEGSSLTRKPLEEAGIRVYQDLSIATETEGGTFQVVTMFQVLEHLSDFQTVLEQCHQLLARGGKIVITVPEGDAMIRQEQLTGCPDMPPNHIGKWSPKSLSRVLTDIGFTPSEAIYEPSSWHNIISSLYLRILSDATKSQSLAAQVYRIPNKRIRVPFLALLGVSAFFRLMPYTYKLSQGGAFAIIGTVD